MPSTVRLDKKQLKGLIDNVKVNGGDAGELEVLLGEVEEEYKKPDQGRPRVKRVQARADSDAEEETTLERLAREVGYLFPNGITDELLEEIIAYDRDHTLAELKTLCHGIGISPSGHKKELAAALIARRLNDGEGRSEQVERVDLGDS